MDSDCYSDFSYSPEYEESIYSMSPEDSDRYPRGQGEMVIDDNCSVYSFHSGDYTHLWRDVHGRKLNATNEIYMLPGDEDEHRRGDMQHRALELCLNSLYFSGERVRRVLAEREGYTPAVIDLGCGSGAWPVAMALEFPHVDILGLDLVPPKIQESIPGNCRFEVDDVNLPLSHYANCFDVVHCRALEVGVKDYEGLLYSIAEILRPEGVLLLVGGDLQLYDEYGRPMPTVDEGKPGFTYVQRLCSSTLQAAHNLGSVNASARKYWRTWVANNPNYEQMEVMDVLLPIGAWPAGLDPQLVYMADLLRRSILRFFHSCLPMLIQDGYPQSVVDRWFAGVERELGEVPSVRTAVRWQFTAVQRTRGKWQPQPGTEDN